MGVEVGLDVGVLLVVAVGWGVSPGKRKEQPMAAKLKRTVSFIKGVNERFIGELHGKKNNFKERWGASIHRARLRYP